MPQQLDLKNVLTAYGWSTVDQMLSSAEWARAIDSVRAKGIDGLSDDEVKGTALEMLSRPEPTRIKLSAFFTGFTTMVSYEEKQRIETRVAKILLTNGKVVNVPSSTLPANSSPVTTKVVLDGILRFVDLGRKAEWYRADQETQVIVAPHDEPFPNVTLDDAFARANFRTRRGTVSGKTHTLATLTIGDRNEIFVNVADSGKIENIKASAYDTSGNRVKVSVPPQRVKELFGTTDSKQIRQILAGQKIVVSGELGISINRPAKPEEIPYINQLITDGLIKSISKREPRFSLTLRGQKVDAYNEVTGEREQKQVRTVMLGDQAAFDVEQQQDNSWRVTVAIATPWFSPSEKTFVYKNGPQTGKPGLMNEGAFIHFVDAAGAKARANPYMAALKAVGF